MRNPLRIVKRRFAAAIQWRVDRSVDIRTAALMATVHGLSQQLTASVASTADWRLEVERSIARLGDAISRQRDATETSEIAIEQLQLAWLKTLREIQEFADELQQQTIHTFNRDSETIESSS